jgi:hypothetical protein
MAARERTYRCVGGPCDGMHHTLGEERRIRPSPKHDEAPTIPLDRISAPSNEDVTLTEYSRKAARRGQFLHSPSR